VSAFFDTNILVYGYDQSPHGVIARGLVVQGGQIAVQSLNELALVLRRRYQLDFADMRAEVDKVATAFPDAVPLTMAIHLDGLRLAERYKLGIYDSMLLAAALSGKCTTFYSEDLADGLVIDGSLTVCNPFA
jgi:predicted nucleic acid-binding protein